MSCWSNMGLWAIQRINRMLALHASAQVQAHSRMPAFCPHKHYLLANEQGDTNTVILQLMNKSSWSSYMQLRLSNKIFQNAIGWIQLSVGKREISTVHGSWRFSLSPPVEKWERERKRQKGSMLSTLSLPLSVHKPLHKPAVSLGSTWGHHLDTGTHIRFICSTESLNGNINTYPPYFKAPVTGHRS